MSMSQLLRWKWKSEKSIATGTHNSELPSARLSCYGPIILDGGRRRAVGSRRPMNGAPGGQHFCSGREPSGLPALWGREKAPPPVGRGLNIIMQSCGSPLSRKLLPQRDNSGRKEWFQKERPRRSGAKCIAEGRVFVFRRWPIPAKGGGSSGSERLPPECCRRATDVRCRKEKPRRSGASDTFLRRIWTTPGGFGGVLGAVHVALVGMVSHRLLSGCDGHHIFAHSSKPYSRRQLFANAAIASSRVTA